LEVLEAIKFLRGDMPEDLKEVVLELGSYMIKLAGRGDNIEENKLKMIENIKNLSAYNKFIELVKNQGGDISYIENIEKFEMAKCIGKVVSPKNGYIHEINAEDVGKLACNLGAGRIRKEDNIDFSVGIVLEKKVSDKVEVGDTIAKIYAKTDEDLELAKNEFLKIVKINEMPCPKKKNIIEIIK
jgi:pyrimidine-nucleoside phosphorylase